VLWSRLVRMYNPRNFSRQSLALPFNYAKEANHAGTLHQVQVGRNRLISLLNPVRLRTMFAAGRRPAFARRRWFALEWQ